MSGLGLNFKPVLRLENSSAVRTIVKRHHGLGRGMELAQSFIVLIQRGIDEANFDEVSNID